MKATLSNIFLLAVFFYVESYAQPSIHNINAVAGGKNKICNTDLVINGENHKTIDFGGDTVTFKKFGLGLKILNATHITIKNMVIQYDPIPYSVGIITKISSDSICLTALKGTTPFDSTFAISSNTKKEYIVFRTPDFKLVNNIYNAYKVGAKKINPIYTSSLDRTHWTVKGNLGSLPLSVLSVGYYYISIPSYWVSQAMYSPLFSPAITIFLSDNIELKNVTVLSSPSVAINLALSSNVLFDNCTVKRKEGFPISANRDALNTADAGGKYDIGPFFINSSVSDMGDDGLNIKSGVIPVTQWLSDTQFTYIFHLKSMLPYVNSNNRKTVMEHILNIGDTLAGVDSMLPTFINKEPIVVSDVADINDSTFIITVKNTPIQYERIKCLFNYSITPNNNLFATISNTSIKQCRRFGIFVTSIKSRVVDNTIDSLAGAGYSIIGYPFTNSNRYFSFPCLSVISNNRITNINLQKGDNPAGRGGGGAGGFISNCPNFNQIYKQ
ncbi:MAG: hypothetical protein QM528_09460 [Phycisphaerales bacterium]|nr:hypothetical protein [Phycisphaerales bacterium]